MILFGRSYVVNHWQFWVNIRSTSYRLRKRQLNNKFIYTARNFTLMYARSMLHNQNNMIKKTNNSIIICSLIQHETCSKRFTQGRIEAPGLIEFGALITYVCLPPPPHVYKTKFKNRWWGLWAAAHTSPYVNSVLVLHNQNDMVKRTFNSIVSSFIK